jgi:hypothetical protein
MLGDEQPQRGVVIRSTDFSLCGVVLCRAENQKHTD